MMPKRVLAAALTMMMALTGCRAIAILMTDPHEKVPAEYKLPKKQKYAIFVDDYMAPTGSLKLKKDLARVIGEDLVIVRVLRGEDLVDTEKVFSLPTDSPDGKRLSIQHIGREAGADYVLYVNVIEFNLQSDLDNPLVQPKARAYVKVIEVASGERVWPLDIAGFAVEAREKMQGEVAVEADTSEWTQKLTDLLAMEVAHLFCEHELRR